MTGGPRPLHDLAGHALGEPSLVVSVRSKAELRAALAEARARGAPFAAVGHLSTYWHNLSLDGAVVADLSTYDREVAFDVDNGVATFESGVTLRSLDAALRARGFHLPMHPDAFGDTLLGSAVANGVTAGLGMMSRDFLDSIVGFELLLTDGRALQVGASRLLGGRPGAVTRGLPDLRSLCFGAEGALGVLTEIDVALVPAGWEARIECQAPEDRFADVLSFAHGWRRRGVLDTLRWVWTRAGQLTIHLSSQVDARELEGRVERVCASLPAWASPQVSTLGDEYRRGVAPGYDAKWPGPPGQTWRGGRAQPFFGLDSVIPYSKITEAYRWARTVPIDAVHRRVACYFGPDGVNLGVHCVSASEAERHAARAALEARSPALADFAAVPYRPGLAWRHETARRADSATLSALEAIGRLLDPDGRLNPGVGLFSARPTPTKELGHDEHT